MDELQHILGQGSPLIKHINSFTSRSGQLAMAEGVAEAIDNHDRLIVEAGTGTGKTFAYLVPAILSGKKIICSTGTKNLQDQLFHRDLPILRKVIKSSLRLALLKGRNNYLCRYRIKHFAEAGQFFSRKAAVDLHKIARLVDQTQFGETAEIKIIAEDSPVWSYATSTSDNCLGQDCPDIADCFVLKARQKALKADITVINHHLFFADLILREVGFGELLPHADVIILDEAHLLPEIASNFFGTSVSARQLIQLARDTERATLQYASDVRGLNDSCAKLQAAVADMRLGFGPEATKRGWQDIANKPALRASITVVKKQLTELTKLLEPQAARHKELENCWLRAVDLSKRFELLTGSSPAEQIHWYETFSKSFTLHFTPLQVAQQFQACMDASDSSWIFTSATLTVNNSFGFYQQQMGLQKAKQLEVACPFDYQQQTCLYLPKDMPEPQSHHFHESLMQAALPVIQAARGRTFFLFTSHSALQKAYHSLRGRIKFPLLVQGQLPKTELLQQFRELGNAVLLGTSSFWEGVDVKGEALSCVIIDKLPFAAPSDPIYRARIEAIRKQGGDPFMEYQVTNAIIALKQGVGRLIRDESDRGVLMICDPRLLTKGYGKMFLDSLPAMPRTRELSDVIAFFEQALNGV